MAAAEPPPIALGWRSASPEGKSIDPGHALLEPARRRPREAVAAREGTEPRGRKRPPRAPAAMRQLGGVRVMVSGHRVSRLPLLLVEKSLADRACLQRGLMARGFTVVGGRALRGADRGRGSRVRLRRPRAAARRRPRARADQAAARTSSRDADRRRHRPRQLRHGGPGAARRSGRLPREADGRSRADRRPARSGTDASLPVPETPLGLQRVCREHVQRTLAQCDRDVSETARRLGMGRRSLQRILSKRAPIGAGRCRRDTIFRAGIADPAAVLLA